MCRFSSLLDHNRDLTRLLGDILVLSPRLAATLRRHPMLFDLVLFQDFFAALPDADGFEADLHPAIDELPVRSPLEIITRMRTRTRFRRRGAGFERGRRPDDGERCACGYCRGCHSRGQ